MQVSYSVSEILAQLDECAEAFTFPILDNAYVYPADTRMTLFRDAERWAILIEVLGFNSHMGGTGGIDDALYCFGNCLRRPPGISPEDTLRPVSDGDSGPLFDDEGIPSAAARPISASAAPGCPCREARSTREPRMRRSVAPRDRK